MSGISLADTVKDQIEAFFVPASQKGKVKYDKCRWIIFGICKEQECDKAEVIKILDKGDLSKTFQDLVDKITEMDAAFVLHDFEMPKKDPSVAGQDAYPIFISWVPDSKCPVKMKMKMSSSEKYLKDICKERCKAVLSCHDAAELSSDEVIKDIQSHIRK